ncbi:hypothetical protein NLG97_g6822 [Lecanicillium saksenae]|uniref:Uncharacterized protein n=1 Tax=Lecanicillium saksenae TaxID=468837 RepID=A0ACC1QQW4_9HYPO|nr:hypothetical protein NLG97_g6822 [Lecanicillium saksenae]
MQILAGLQLAILASQALAMPAANDKRYVPGMAPGSSPSEADKKSLPGVNHKPLLQASMLFDANVNTTAWSVVSKDMPADAVFGAKCLHLSMLGDGKKGQSTLQAACLDDEDAAEGKGTWWLTSLNLNKCLGNDRGRLVFQQGGNFDSSCRPCGIDSSLTTSANVKLRCSCLPNADGVGKFTEIPLAGNSGDLGIKAVNGRLVCGDHEGTKSPHFNNTSGNGGEI